jgi:hypothetical protein
MAMGKIILLNGPPSSGKDTAAKHIRDWYHGQRDMSDQEQWNNRCALDRMSMPIKRAFAGTMSLPIDADGNCQPWESKKEEVIPEFGISYRQWQIDFSESFLKKYDEAIFGTLLSTRIERRFAKGIANLVVIPDCGFKIEIETLYANFDPKDILLVRCHRNGFNFVGDSRSYVRAPKGCAVFNPMNAMLPEYLAQVEAGVRCWLETPERMPREE